MILDAPRAVAAAVNELLERGDEVWLIGSRANGTAKATSNWDFIVIGSSGTLGRLRSQAPIPDLDLLVVFDGDEFSSPWPRIEDGNFKTGSLRRWQWQRLSEELATYEATKWPDDGAMEIATKQAARVHECQTTA